MTTYRITARELESGIVVYVGVEQAISERLAVMRALAGHPKYAARGWCVKAEPMLLRWPGVTRAAG